MQKEYTQLERMGDCDWDANFVESVKNGGLENGYSLKWEGLTTIEKEFQDKELVEVNVSAYTYYALPEYEDFSFHEIEIKVWRDENGNHWVKSEDIGPFFEF